MTEFQRDIRKSIYAHRCYASWAEAISLRYNERLVLLDFKPERMNCKHNNPFNRISKKKKRAVNCGIKCLLRKLKSENKEPKAGEKYCTVTTSTLCSGNETWMQYVDELVH